MYLTNINLGQYIPTGSFIHRLDPRAKLFSLLFIISSVFPAKTLLGLSFWTAALIAVVYASKISWRIVLKAARPVFFLIIFTFAFNLLMTYFRSGFFPALKSASFMSSRLLVLMLFAVLLPLTTAPLELADGLDALLRPLEKFHFPAHETAMMIGMALRFIPLLMQETDKIMRAQLSRGARLDQGNIFQRVKAFFPVLIPLFIIIFRRADDIAVAMEARGYDGGAGRTRRKPLTWKRVDTLAVILCALAMGVSLFGGVINTHFARAVNEKYYASKVREFQSMSRTENNIIFLGDSITDFLNFDEFLPGKNIINRGIAGDTTRGVLARLDEVISLKPRKLFLLIGTNDIAMGRSVGTIAKNIAKIITELQEKTPATKIYVQSLFPTNKSKFNHTARPNAKITALNDEIAKISSEKNCTFINLFPLLLRDGELDENFTLDGLHLNGEANAKWLEFLAPYLDK